MSIVNAECTRIAERITKADAEREHCIAVLARAHDQSERHKVEYKPQRELAVAADAKVAALLANVVESLAEEATSDGAEFLAAQQDAYKAHRAKAYAPRFRRRSATRTANDADARHQAAEQVVRTRWRGVPHSESGLPAWAKAVAQGQGDHEPEIIEARAEATKAHRIAKAIAARQSRERTALYERVLGNRRQNTLTARVKSLRQQATRDRSYQTQLDALPPEEAVSFIHECAAQVEAQRLPAESTPNSRLS